MKSLKISVTGIVKMQAYVYEEQNNNPTKQTA